MENKRKLSLEEHQSILYDILFAVDDFCKMHDINYFLAHGSLLGAIRHRGIIPWDDDIDLWMKREDFIKFEKLSLKYKIPGYTVNSFQHTKGYYYPFIKVSKNNTILIEPYTYVPKEGIGINIDIFPIDGCPSESFTIAQDYSVNSFNNIWKNLLFWTDMRWNRFKGLKQKLIYLKYVLPFQRKRLFAKIYEDVSKYPIDNSAYFGNVVWHFHIGDCIYKTEWISNTSYVYFGERLLPVPQNFDEILKANYGDYMTPPPEEKRKSTHDHGDGVYIIEHNSIVSTK